MVATILYLIQLLLPVVERVAEETGLTGGQRPVGQVVAGVQAMEEPLVRQVILHPQHHHKEITVAMEFKLVLMHPVGAEVLARQEELGQEPREVLEEMEQHQVFLARL
jgi:hypothetical protein